MIREDQVRYPLALDSFERLINGLSAAKRHKLLEDMCIVECTLKEEARLLRCVVEADKEGSRPSVEIIAQIALVLSHPPEDGQ